MHSYNYVTAYVAMIDATKITTCTLPMRSGFTPQDDKNRLRDRIMDQANFASLDETHVILDFNDEKRCNS